MAAKVRLPRPVLQDLTSELGTPGIEPISA